MSDPRTAAEWATYLLKALPLGDMMDAAHQECVAVLGSYARQQVEVLKQKLEMFIPWNVNNLFKQYGCSCQHHASGDEDCSPCCQWMRFILAARTEES